MLLCTVQDITLLYYRLDS